MEFWSLWLTLVGLVLTLVGAGWLWFKIDPDNPKYADDGPNFPGDRRSLVLPRFIADQRRPSVVVLVGGVVQVAGGVLALLAYLR